MKKQINLFPCIVKNVILKKFKCLFFFFFLFSAFGFIPNTVLSQNDSVLIDKDQTLSIDQVFKLIKSQTDYNFIYKEDLFEQVPEINLVAGTLRVNELLDKCLDANKFTYSVSEDKTILIKQKAPVQAELQKSITGTIKDVTGFPLIGVTILVKDQRRGTTSDMDGNYSILVNEGETLVFSYIGFKTEEIIVGADSVINVVLNEDIEELSQVVITGYYERKKESFTGTETNIKGEELVEISNQNVLSALSVAVPAFKFVENNLLGSDPNNLPDFQIRGSSSINSSTDGSSDLNSEFQNAPNLPTFILDGFEVSSEVIFDLDPNRIKSATVLRDASATAIYGSRAANGVVVIETKRPEKGMMNVIYNMNLDLVAADLSDYNLMNAREKLQYEVLAGLYTHPNVNQNERLQAQYNEKLQLVQRGIDTDWITFPVRELGLASAHSLFLEGGDDHFLYSFGLNHKNTPGAMKGSNRKRTGATIKLQHNRKDLRFVNTLNFNKVSSANSHYGSFSAYTFANPYYYPYDGEGRIQETMYVFEDGVTVPNILYNATLNSRDDSEYTNLINNFSFSWDINDNFRLTSRFGLNLKKSSAHRFIPPENTIFNNSQFKGSYTIRATDEFSYDGNMVLSYNKLINEKHLINAVGIYNISERKIDRYSVAGQNYPNSNLDHIGMGIQYPEGGRPTGNFELQRLVGLVGNFNYSYDNRYVADFSVRTDASSIFGANDRWGTFFSGGLGWNMHQESFLKNSDNIRLLKLRTSFGQTGGTKFNPYQSFLMFNYNNPALDGLTYNGNLGALLIALGNPDLKWQINNKFNLGLDWSLFDGWFSGNFNYYNEISKNQLISVTLAPSTGFPSYTENLGKVKNEGIELSLKQTLIKSEESRLKWDVFINILHNKNSLLEINDALTAFNDRQDELAGNEDNPNTNPVVKYQEGQSINTIWVVKSRGIDPATGREIFVDRNGNLTNQYSFADQMPAAIRDPKIEGTFGTFLNYKNFQLGAYFSYKMGGYLYNQTLVSKVENINPRNNADKRVLFDRWQQPGDVALYKAINNTSTTFPTSRFVQKDNELRFSTLNLTYNFDRELLAKWNINRLKVTAIGNDVFRLNSSNIERGINYPFARYYSLNLQISI